MGVALLLAATAFAPVVSRSGLRIERTYHANGHVATERRYVHGREEGAHRGWWPDGSRHFAYTYREGLLEGLATEWFASGARYREQRYRAGQEQGLQRMYWLDGRVRASYEVRDGRRFGLMGSKGCVTRKDSLETEAL